MTFTTAVLAAGPQGPTTEITGTSDFSRWQYDLILYSFVVALFALAAGAVYLFSTRHEIAPRYRSSAVAGSLVCAVATLAYVALTLTWLLRYSANADGTSYTPDPGTSVTGLRYADWSVTVPLLTIELIGVCVLSRAATLRARFIAVAAAFLMIITGYLGVIAVGQSSAGTVELLVWGAVSTVFFIVLYPVLLAPVRETRAAVGAETSTSLRNAVILLLSVFGVYPIVYLVPLWAGDQSSGWATTIQLSFTAADVAAKVGFGMLVHKVAKLRTAEDIAAAGPDPEGPVTVWISEHQYPETAAAAGARGRGRVSPSTRR